MTHPDAIQPIPANPGPWCENAVFAAYDSKVGVSVWAHWGRIPGAAHIWEGYLGVFLPAGGLLVSRAFGPAPRDDEASTGALSFRCLEPGQRWHVEFDGMARPASQAELIGGPLVDGPVERLVIDLEFEAVHEIYGGGANQQEWATAHFDQGGRVAGTVAHGGETYAISSGGFRDHSYGPRDYSTVVGDTWCTAVFPSGRALLGVEVWQAEGPPYRQGFTFDGTTLRPATDMRLPRLSAADGAPHNFTMTLTTEAGTTEFSVEQQASMALTFGRPVGLVAGARTDDPELPVITEGPARITWDGEVTDGWIEKSMRVTEFASGR